jgi:hypothetical protein
MPRVHRLSPPRPLRVVTPAPREVGAYADTRWRRYSRAFRRRNPFCRFCDQRGRLRFSTVVDQASDHKEAPGNPTRPK